MILPQDSSLKPFETSKNENYNPSPPIGYGMDGSQNQNRLIDFRNGARKSTLDFNPTQQDLFDLIGKSSSDQSQVTTQKFEQKSIAVSQASSQFINTIQRVDSVNIYPAFDTNPFLNQSQIIQEVSEVRVLSENNHFQQEDLQEEQYANEEKQDQENDLTAHFDYDGWLKGMKRQDFVGYLAWFNHKIKQDSQAINQDAPFFPPDHDFTIRFEEPLSLSSNIQQNREIDKKLGDKKNEEDIQPAQRLNTLWLDDEKQDKEEVKEHIYVVNQKVNVRFYATDSQREAFHKSGYLKSNHPKDLNQRKFQNPPRFIKNPFNGQNQGDQVQRPQFSNKDEENRARKVRQRPESVDEQMQKIIQENNQGVKASKKKLNPGIENEEVNLPRGSINLPNIFD